MKERPILFSAPMVRAILDGRKTQTRRVVKLPHQNPLGQWEATTDPAGPGAAIWHTRTGNVIACPFGQPGDRLWVRETWGVLTGAGRRYVYRADGDPEQQFFPGERISNMKWHPSIHMPRWASRITLEVTGVRVEGLAEISEEDARAEGVDLGQHASTFGAFGALWDSIHGEGAHALNPWVWVIGFARVEAAAQARTA